MYDSPDAKRALYEHGRKPRLLGWLLFSTLLVLMLVWLNPHNLPVIQYKLALVVLAAVLGYWIDRALFPYARPHATPEGWYRAMAMLRRAVIVLACILGLTLGL